MTGNEKSYWKNESYKAYCPNIILSHDLTIGEAGKNVTPDINGARVRGIFGRFIMWNRGEGF